MRLGRRAGRRTTAALPLDRLTAVEITDVGRPMRRMAQGLLVLGASLVLGIVIWVVLDVFLFALLVAGVPGLIGVYMLTGYAFPDDQGELALHAGAYALRLPLLSDAARQDSYLLAQRVFELMATASPRVERGGAPKSSEAGSDRSAVEAADTAGPAPSEVTQEPEASQVVDHAASSVPEEPHPTEGASAEEPADGAEAIKAPARRRTVRKAASSDVEEASSVPKELPADTP